ncbi:hypothetical protein TanjilG_12274 [Lupinus angustifolius]|uniref:Uncharacterized protein n=1 Tax=Lupinus angustifolius TaxID=3871 RepID=A0A394DQ53_LUPAN|nr:hypothetical protein TanjilG_12274 [Lupinus angustifolius]
MLEGPSFLVTRNLPCSCELETEWIYNSLCVMELANNKHRLELEEEAVLRKLCKLSHVPKEGESHRTILDFSQTHSNDQPDSSSLIHQLGRDISIHCLLKCSRSDYGSIALLNRRF